MSLLRTLYEAYCDFVEEIQKERAQHLQRRRELLRRVRPWLEGLGERIVPAAIDWVGGFSSPLTTKTTRIPRSLSTRLSTVLPPQWARMFK
jgi:hypothetical protein